MSTNTILVVDERRWVRDALLQAFDDRGLVGTGVNTVQEALDYVCTGGRANLILYNGAQSQVRWALRRAQDANPALLHVPMVAIWPLKNRSEHSRPKDAVSEAPIDVPALLLIVGQLCQRDVSGAPHVSQRQC